MSTGETLEAALQHHQHGRLAEAEQIYYRLLREDPNHAQALQLLGVAAAQRGDRLLAAEYRRKSVAAGAKESSFYANLGFALQMQRQLDEAEAAHLQALTLDADCAEAHNNLGVLDRMRGRHDQAAERFRQAMRCDPLDPRFPLNLGLVQLLEGARDEALASFRRVLELQPDHAEASYHVQVLTGAAEPGVLPKEHVIRAFDAYAPSFDEHLLKGLHYRAPALLRRIVGELPAESVDVLDLGCGTGLAGAAFRPSARRLVGVDLSPEMIARARERGTYDELIVGDILEPLGEPMGVSAAFDLILAADVFVYVGDLRPVFTAVRQALRPGGRFAFTVEAHVGAGLTMLETGRFAHSESYLRELARACGFEVSQWQKAPLRRERAQVIEGYVCLLSAPGA